jgi:hypothetical protein
MVERAENAKAQLKVRLREPLRARLEAEARNNGYSLNTEIVRRLEESIREEDFGARVFGDDEMFATMDTLARLIRAVELRTGKPWTADRETYELAVETIYRVLKNGPRLLATGEYPGGVRDIADVGALALIERLLKTDAERRAGDA